MQIDIINERSFSVYISEQEVICRGFTLGSITKADASRLIRDIVHTEGYLTLELFEGKHELLIFARRKSGNLKFFSFCSIEDVIAATDTIDLSEAASLFFYEGNYILVFWDESVKIESVSEFSEELHHTSGFVEHLYEHGKLLCDYDAIFVIKCIFSC
jgi:hypothetical protein